LLYEAAFDIITNCPFTLFWKREPTAVHAIAVSSQKMILDDRGRSNKN